MALVIHHNIASLSSQRYLGLNNRSAGKSVSRLASGLKINSAADDAAGLTISEKMKGQIRGLAMAKKNAQDTTSLIQVADGALNQTHAVLGRMRELAVQAVNGANTDDDRNELEKELRQLKKEIDRIGNTTEFNTRKLLDGSAKGITNAAKGVVTLNRNYQEEIYGQFKDDLMRANFASTIEWLGELHGRSIFYDGTVTVVRNSTQEGIPAFKVIFCNAPDIDANPTAITAYIDNDGVELSGGGGDNGYGVKASGGASPGTYLYEDGKFTTLDGQIGFWETYPSYQGTISDGAFGFGGIFLGAVPDANLLSRVWDMGLNKAAVGESISLNFRRTQRAKGTLDQSLMTQLGANTGQTTYLSIGDMRAQALGLRYTHISSQDAAVASMTEIDNATVRVSAERSLLGALQNRMDYAREVIETTSENLSAAESRLRDADMAKEMSAHTGENIKSQAAQSMIAQANARAQNVLNLLR